MLRKIQKALRFTIVGAIAFGFAGLVLGFIHTREPEEWMMWAAGFALIGAFAGIALAFLLGKYRMMLKLALLGAIAGALSYFLIIYQSEMETWLQLTILGLLAGALSGFIISMYDTGKSKAEVKKLPAENKIPCDACGHMVGENDRFCSGCGAEFE
jgi:peptidoglycan/LPS O-acetylase OafA/YrhL